MVDETPKSLSIVLLNPYLPPPVGGIEVEMLALAREFAHGGHRVHVVATDSRFPRGSNRAEQPRLPRRVGLTRLRGFGRSVLRGFQPSRAPLLVPGLRRAVLKQAPDLVIVFNVGWPLTVAGVIKGLGDVPVLYRTYYHPPGGRLRRAKERLLLGVVGRAHRAVTASEAERTQLLRTGLLEQERVRVVRPGVESFPADKEGLARFKQEHRLEGKRAILHVARLSRFKGSSHLIEVLPRVRRQAGDDVVLVLVGHGSEEQQLRGLMTKNGVEEQVRWVGPIADDADLRLAYRAAHVFALPSAYESFGFVFLEALKEGVPVVACPGGGVEEAVGDGGFVLPAYGDLDALEQALVTLLTDEPRRQSLAEAGRRRVLHLHRWSQAAGALLALRDEILQA